MFLSVVILGGFTTETHAMAPLQTRTTRRRYLQKLEEALVGSDG
jgi:hypothetical protein